MEGLVMPSTTLHTSESRKAVSEQTCKFPVSRISQGLLIANKNCHGLSTYEQTRHSWIAGICTRFADRCKQSATCNTRNLHESSSNTGLSHHRTVQSGERNASSANSQCTMLRRKYLPREFGELLAVLKPCAERAACTVLNVCGALRQDSSLPDVVEGSNNLASAPTCPRQVLRQSPNNALRYKLVDAARSLASLWDTGSGARTVSGNASTSPSSSPVLGRHGRVLQEKLALLVGAPGSCQ